MVCAYNPIFSKRVTPKHDCQIGPAVGVDYVGLKIRNYLAESTNAPDYARQFLLQLARKVARIEISISRLLEAFINFGCFRRGDRNAKVATVPQTEQCLNVGDVTSTAMRMKIGQQNSGNCHLSPCKSLEHQWRPQLSRVTSSFTLYNNSWESSSRTLGLSIVRSGIDRCAPCGLQAFDRSTHRQRRQRVDVGHHVDHGRAIRRQ